MAMGWELDEVERPLVEQLVGMGWQHLAGSLDDPSRTDRAAFSEVDQEGVLRGPTASPEPVRGSGVKPSYSRPRVSDDNAFVESLFRTAKYRPEFPTTGFADLRAAREWAHRFVHWYVSVRPRHLELRQGAASLISIPPSLRVHSRADACREPPDVAW